MNRFGLTIVLLLPIMAATARVANAMDETQLRALDQKCEDARAARLAPVRERMARQCEQEKRYLGNQERDCKLEMSTYGDTFSGARGAAIRGQFYDLPECVAAAAAWKEWEASRPWKD